MTCQRCSTAEPVEGGGDPRVCGFYDTSGTFNENNFMCMTLMELRCLVLAADLDLNNCEQHATLLPMFDESGDDDGTFLVMGWYKSRGRTEYIGVMDEGVVVPATLTQVEQLLNSWHHVKRALQSEPKPDESYVGRCSNHRELKGFDPSSDPATRSQMVGVVLHDVLTRYEGGDLDDDAARQELRDRLGMT